MQTQAPVGSVGDVEPNPLAADVDERFTVGASVRKLTGRNSSTNSSAFREVHDSHTYEEVQHLTNLILLCDLSSSVIQY